MNKLIATFKKNKFQEIRVMLREFKGNDIIDIRTWTVNQGFDESDNMVPTVKGITIKVDKLADLQKALMQTFEVLKENNMI